MNNGATPGDPVRPQDAPGRPPEPDAHGQAAMLLVESLIHTMLHGNVISLRQAVETVDVAMDVKAEVAERAGDSKATMERSLALLNHIGVSLRVDLPAV